MAITQLSAVKNLPYIVSNVMALFTVLPLAIAVIVFANVFKRLLRSWTLIGIGMISYEIYLVHAFTLEFVKGSIMWIGVFMISTIGLSVVLHLLMRFLYKAKR